MQLVDAEAHAVEGARREVLDDHIGVGAQALGDLTPGIVLEVEADAALAAIEPREPRRRAVNDAVVVTREVALTLALYLYDVGAEVGQVSRSKGRRDRLLKGDDADASQGEIRLLRSGAPYREP